MSRGAEPPVLRSWQYGPWVLKGVEGSLWGGGALFRPEAAGWVRERDLWKSQQEE